MKNRELEAMIEQYFGETGLYPNLPYREAIRKLLVPEYSDASDEEIDEFLFETMAGMSPEEIEGFLSSIGNFLRRAAPAILPAAGTVLGTIVGGPAGAALGGTLGRVAGQALGGSQRTRRPTSRIPTARRTQTARVVNSPIPAGGTSAAAQLTSLIQNPVFLQSLLGRLLGNAGQTTVRVGRQGVPVNFGSFMNALAQLATQAAMEVEESDELGEETPAYLMDESGNLKCDAAVPEQRAKILMELINESRQEEQGVHPTWDQLTEWFVEAGMVA